MPSDTCSNCGGNIQVMIFRGMGYCSELCRKALAGRDADGTGEGVDETKHVRKTPRRGSSKQAGKKPRKRV